MGINISQKTYRLLGDDLLVGRSGRAGRLLHGKSVGVEGSLGGLLLGRLEPVAEHCDRWLVGV